MRKLTELIKTIAAWLQREGDLIGLLYAWHQVAQQEVTQKDKIYPAPR